ncbi:hypothetical protein P154DRAFT_539171 [Amniculicola lignicola CBS 123094]|uniref:Uncharacterized protein n=1 Tax=Amniculicola lignicola CBS 123094 TaxID=1392246 RepID=A0A6A5W0T5_9PLEO|nr:hypothetical protein P154DRAFT_539171 [Amniculicola lignicola CBS 123094]
MASERVIVVLAFFNYWACLLRSGTVPQHGLKSSPSPQTLAPTPLTPQTHAILTMAPIRSQMPSTGTASVPRKRQRAEIDSASRLTRAKYTATDSSSREHFVSDDSVLLPSSISEPSSDASEADSDSDSDSELSVSSEDPSSDSDDDESEMDIDKHEEDADRITNLRANQGQKPTIRLSEVDLGPDLRPWLEDFLPKLKAANEELEVERAAGTLAKRAIEIDDDQVGEGQHIEMNLGLGVLEERDPDANSSSSEDSSSDEEDDEGEAHAVKAPREKNVMGRLMGRGRTLDKPVIQEVNKDV